MRSINSICSDKLMLVNYNDAEIKPHERIFIIGKFYCTDTIDVIVDPDQQFTLNYHATIESFLTRCHSADSEQRDLVLLDVRLLIHVDYELPLLLKRLSSYNYSLILLVGDESDDFIASCMLIGADDYYCASQSVNLLSAKINTQFRRLDLVAAANQVQVYSKNKKDFLREQALAKTIFDRVTEKYDHDLGLIDAWLSPVAVFNGDILLKAVMPNGGLIALLGDFTGHGLTAAIGAMPLASSFYAMVAKGFSMRDIIHELNDKLYTLLPSNIFCCAAVVQFNFVHGTVDVWNGGLPDVVIQSCDSGNLTSVASSQLPLGVVDNSRYQLKLSCVNVTKKDRIWLLSDGLLEGRNALGESFGSDRFLAALYDSRHLDTPVALVQRQFDDFSNHADQADDVSLVKISMLSEIDYAALQTPLSRCQSGEYPCAWRLSLRVYPASLKYSDPIPQLLHQLMVLPAMRRYNHCLFTVLTELYNNALDHGLLQLASVLKSDTAGFEQFYTQRQHALAALESGWIELSVDFTADDNGATIQLDVVDSGAGFDLSDLIAEENIHTVQSELLTGQHQVHGRGIALVDSLCERLDYLGCGNHARASMSLRFQ